MAKEKLRSIQLLKCIAAIMVLNSHFESVYPIPALATGGALANGVFFIVSGFLVSGFNKPFLVWYSKRLGRLWIGIVLVSLFQILVGYTALGTPMDWISTFFIPKYYWFATALAIFYPILYLLKKKEMFDKGGLKWVTITVVLLYFVSYSFLDTSVWVVETKRLDSFAGLFKLIYYFYIMYLGLYIKFNNTENKKMKHPGRVAIVSFVSMYIMKAVMVRIPTLMHFQFLNQLSVLFFSVSMLLFSLYQEKLISQILSNSVFTNVVNGISKITWEIYLVQFMVINSLNSYIFPVNFIMIIIVVIVAAIILNVLSQWVYQKLFKG
uniref:Acyltransferase family protein n=1 Tax=Erysipelothrix tonsillarum TaxID=38402 RepID=A0A6S6I1D6_9FIRM|nr:acyltransferase family protein [Erysipelothrix tonsillarum]